MTATRIVGELQAPRLDLIFKFREGESAPDFLPDASEEGRNRAAWFCATKTKSFEAELNRIASDESDYLWRSLKEDEVIEELVVGCGMHATVYAASSRTFPLCVEAGAKLGGIFGLATRPVFMLNSRNRPGDAGLPGQSGALNYLPECLLQLADITGAEYPTQNLLGLVLKLNLLLYAQVMVFTQVEQVRRSSDGRWQVVLNNAFFGQRKSVYADRVIFATGAGTPNSDLRGSSKKVYDFNQFIRRTPSKQYYGENIAVIGNGDSACAAIGVLLGQEPGGQSVPASAWFPNKITWFGQDCQTREEFQAARSRYAGIGRYMPREYDENYYYRVQSVPGRTLKIEDGLTIAHETPGGTFKRFTGFDSVILCAGYKDTTKIDFESLVPKWQPIITPVSDGKTIVAVQYTGTEVYKIGPCAQLALSDGEEYAIGIPENSAALFRYGPKTASFGRMMRR